MKITHALALGLLLTACGGDDATDSGSDTGTTATGSSRLAVDAPGLDAERAAPTAGDRAVDTRRGLTVSGSRGATDGSPDAGSPRKSARPALEGVIDREAPRPYLAPLPTDPEDEHLSVLTIVTDSGDDGTADRVQRSTFDSASHRIMLEEDRDGDGAFEVVQAFAHYTDDQNRVVRIETDDGADGTVDSVETRIFGDNGRVERVEKDTDADGVADRVELSDWNADGRKTAWRVDNTNDGQFDMEQTWGFGPDGRSHARALKRFANGTLSGTTLYTNRYAEDGKLAAIEVDKEGDGTPTNIMHRSYDEKGRMLETRSDLGADGSVDNLTRYVYDDDGRLSQLVIDTGNDGKVDTRISRYYEGFKTSDCFGR